jgi:uncharacterized protein
MVGSGEKMRAPDLNHLEKVFKKYPDVLAVYLFGSTSSGRAHRGSDLDLAVVPGTKELMAKKLEILADLAREGFCNVDLIFIDGDDVVLHYEAVRRNKLVYQIPSFERGTTYSNVVRKYLDFYPYLAVQREAYKKRMLDDKAGSPAQETE